MFEERDPDRPCPEINPGMVLKIGQHLHHVGPERRNALERFWVVVKEVAPDGTLIVRVDNDLKLSNLPRGRLIRVHRKHILEAATRTDESDFAKALQDAYHSGTPNPVRTAARGWREKRLASGVAIHSNPRAVLLLGDTVLT